jgi:hypothetical protein
LTQLTIKDQIDDSQLKVLLYPLKSWNIEAAHQREELRITAVVIAVKVKQFVLYNEQVMNYLTFTAMRQWGFP